MNKTLLAIAGMLLTLTQNAGAQATRVKDIATVQGVRGNQLIGYGLVVGLDGTGDGTGAAFTPQSVASLLQKFGVTVPAGALKVKNVAAVMVTATLPAYVRNGSTVDVTVSSLGDARSLQGGTLLQTPLQAADGQVYAAAQGSVSVGGFLAGGAGGQVSKNHVTAGRIPGGAFVERDVSTTLAGADSHTLQITLSAPDFMTAARVAHALANHLPSGATFSRALDASTVQVGIAPGADTVTLIAMLEDAPVQTDTPARVVINERTGTVVMGGDVTVSPCAVAHGSLTVQITDTTSVSQPAPLSNGATVVVPSQQVKVQEGNERLIPIPSSASLSKVVASLNALGVTPRDLIAILQAMKDAGALHADIEVQ